MKHLIISREYPPANYVPGGIGTYVANIARLMAERGEIVHIIGERWAGAPMIREAICDGRLIVHRIGKDDVPNHVGRDKDRLASELRGLKETTFPTQWFAWHAAFLAERLINEEGVDVVEGQEWEAPLYYFLLRRALGIGPRRHPPCIVHLHSASEFIRLFNGARLFNGTSFLEPSDVPMKRMETFCIRAADALLCPSLYYARQCSEHFGLPAHRIKVIPYPRGSSPIIERSRDVWANGSVCFVGRLEPRKGIVEWMGAASRVAQEDPAVHFDFVGGDTRGLRRPLVEQLPRALRPRFRFHGSKTRPEIQHILAEAKAAVVPSRWENFPNVCIEAMSSGLPVIATRLGGMTEMLEDERTGWLAPDTGVAGMVDGLATALRRCLGTSPDRRASMGRAAADAVGTICENSRTVEMHVAFRAEVSHLGAQHSPTIAGLSRPDAKKTERRIASNGQHRGAGIVVRAETLAAAALPLQSIRAQTTSPSAVVIVCARHTSTTPEFKTQLTDNKAVVVFNHKCFGAEAWNLGFSAGKQKADCGYWLFLDSDDSLEPDCVARVEHAFMHRPEIGIVALWTQRTVNPRALEAPLCPEIEYQLRQNDATPASAYRTEAIGAEQPFAPGLPPEYEAWDLANRILAAGWLAIGYPQILACRRLKKPTISWPQTTALRAVRAELLRRFGSSVTGTALNLIDDYVPIPLAYGTPPHARLTAVILHPRRAARTVLRWTRAVASSIVARVGSIRRDRASSK